MNTHRKQSIPGLDSLPIPSLRLMSAQVTSDVEQEASRAHHIAQDDAPSFQRWLNQAPEEALSRLRTSLQRAAIFGSEDPMIEAEEWDMVRKRTQTDRGRLLDALRSDDSQDLAAWMNQQSHPCVFERALRQALFDGRHGHVPALIEAAICINPELVVLSAWSADHPVPTSWGIHWFTQIPEEKQAAIAHLCAKNALAHQRMSWLKALAHHAKSHSVPLDWGGMLSQKTSNQNKPWTAGIEWLIDQKLIDPAPHLETHVANGEHEQANWLMCRLPTFQRVKQLDHWNARQPGFFDQAQAFHEAQVRQQRTPQLDRAACLSRTRPRP